MAAAVAGVAVVAAVASYEHAHALVQAHGEAGWTGRLVPLTVDGLIYASSMVMLDSARRKTPVPGLARWLLGLGIAATLAANVAHGLGHGPVGAPVAAWPAVALVGSYELLILVIRSSQAASDGTPGSGSPADPLQEHAAEVFADQLAADRVPSVRAIRAQLRVGQPRAQRLVTSWPQAPEVMEKISLPGGFETPSATRRSPGSASPSMSASAPPRAPRRSPTPGSCAGCMSTSQKPRSTRASRKRT
jgi:hypothetical protein